MSSPLVVNKTVSGRYTAETKGQYKGVVYAFYGFGDTQKQAIEPVVKATNDFKKFVDRVF